MTYNVSKETCYACLGSQYQNDQHNYIAEETQLPTVRRETTAIINEILLTRTDRNTNVVQHISITNQKQKPHTPNKENSTPTVTSKSAHSENIEMRLKDLRQLEIRLKKKEEQLKIKQTMLNEDAKEKSKILDRLFKAESRNSELEQTVKTLNRRIEILEEHMKTDHQKNIPSGVKNRETLSSTDELIKGVHE